MSMVAFDVVAQAAKDLKAAGVTLSPWAEGLATEPRGFAHAFGHAYTNLRHVTTAQVGALWDGIGQHNQEELWPWLDQLASILEPSQQTMAEITAAYTGEALGAGQVVEAPVGVGPAVHTEAFYDMHSGSFYHYWKAQKEGVAEPDALAAGKAMAQKLVDNDLQTTMLDAAAATAAQAGTEIKGWRRVPQGKTCDFCMLVSTKLYKTHQLRPLHDHCDCSIAPVLATDDLAWTKKKPAKPLPEPQPVAVAPAPPPAPPVAPPAPQPPQRAPAAQYGWPEFDAKRALRGYDAWTASQEQRRRIERLPGSDEGRYALDRYKGSGYRPMNRYLRYPEDELHDKEGLAELIRNMDNLMERQDMRTHADMVLKRGVRSHARFNPGRWKVGEVRTEDAYHSLTSSGNIARNFAGSDGWIITTHVPQGTRWLPGTDYEREWIIERGMPFRVLRHDAVKKEVTIELLPPEVVAA